MPNIKTTTHLSRPHFLKPLCSHCGIGDWNTPTRTHACMHTRTHAHTHTCTHSHTHTHIHAHANVWLYIFYVLAWTRQCAQTESSIWQWTSQRHLWGCAEALQDSQDLRVFWCHRGCYHADQPCQQAWRYWSGLTISGNTTFCNLKCWTEAHFLGLTAENTHLYCK